MPQAEVQFDMLFGEKISATIRSFDADIGQSAVKGLKLPGQTLDFLTNVASASPYLAGLIQQEQRFLKRVVVGSPEDALAKAQKLDRHLDVSLRRAKARTALVLALADLAGLRDLAWVTQNLTDFADRAVDASLRHCLQAARKKLPKDALKADPYVGVFVLAMGKMGAGELNYSSDIDLIFFFDDSTFDATDAMYIRPVLSKVVRATAQLLNERTEDGYVFRTDLRLRPNPAVTPVCVGVSSAENYYLRDGRTWERAAFIKARVCAGNRNAGAAFLEKMQDFIWRQRLDFAALSEIEEQLNLTRAHKGLVGEISAQGHNLKLGRGGIREIEFFVQSKQLIYGGRRESLRVRGTIEGLQALAKAGLIAANDARKLAKTYTELRRLEHRTQMLRDAQTHSVPMDQDFKRLVKLSGAASDRGFKSALVRLFQQTETITQAERSEVTARHAPDQTALKAFDHICALPVLQSDRAQDSLSRLLPRLWVLLQDQSDEAEALAHVTAFFAALPRGVQPLAMFDQNPALLQDMVHLACLSKPLAVDLARNFEQLYGQIDPHQKPAEIEKTDIEGALISLRKWKNERQFLITHDQLLGSGDFPKAERAYTELAEDVLGAAVDLALAETRTKYGNIAGKGVAVLAMGKLASGEITARSDLDLIILYDGDPSAESDGVRGIELRGYYTYFTRRLITALSVEMAGGKLYEVDMRLRPSGRAGTVATSLSAFDDYQRNKAWVWEHLALTRARAIGGPDDLCQEIEQVRYDVLRQKATNPALVKELKEMRKRIGDLPKQPAKRLSVKKPLGGALDIELVAQALALRHGLVVNQPRAQLKAAAKMGAIKIEQAEQLCEAHIFFGTLEHLKRLLGREDFDADDLSQAGLALLLKRTGSDSLSDLKKVLQSRLSASRACIKSIISQMDRNLARGS
ncbi:MAG: bifunctional glutamine synthetase adenylyltransferase/deadenyltransferase [Pseudomonadota bacterium]